MNHLPEAAPVIGTATQAEWDAAHELPILFEEIEQDALPGESVQGRHRYLRGTWADSPATKGFDVRIEPPDTYDRKQAEAWIRERFATIKITGSSQVSGVISIIPGPAA